MPQKKLPRKAKQWAREAYSSMELAWEIFAEQYENPTPQEKYELLSLAAPIAAINRGMTKNKHKIDEATQTVIDEFLLDIGKNPDEPVVVTQAFLFAYMDAHLSLKLISEKMANETIEHLFANFDVDYDPFPEKIADTIPGVMH